MEVNPQKIMLLAAAIQNETDGVSTVRVPVGEFVGTDGQLGQFQLVATTDFMEQLDACEQHQCITQ
ncbi:MAG: hypothetical protein ACRBBW_20460 [Cellvibrionaceae bacterium]